MRDDFLINLARSVEEERAVKAAQKRIAAGAAAEKILGPRPAAPPPPPDPLALLEEQLAAIDRAGVRDETRAREDYFELLARLAPARTGPVPPPDAHAMALPSTKGAPTPEEVLAVIKAAGKTREQLKQDLITWTRLRDQADLASKLPELQAAEQRAEAAQKAEETAFEAVEAEWAGKIEAKRRLKNEAEIARSRAYQALQAIREAQGIPRKLMAVRLPSIPDASRATQAELAQEEEAKRRRAEIEEAGRRMNALAEVFFPAPPQPEERTLRLKGASWHYAPQGKP